MPTPIPLPPNANAKDSPRDVPPGVPGIPELPEEKRWHKVLLLTVILTVFAAALYLWISPVRYEYAYGSCRVDSDCAVTQWSMFCRERTMTRVDSFGPPLYPPRFGYRCGCSELVGRCAWVW